VETAHGAIDRHHAAGRVEKVAGDFSEAVPAGADGYLLKWIIHDWDDEAAVRILTNCRTAMAPAGRVLLIEAVSPQGTAESDATRVDTAMLVFTGSREPHREGVSRPAPSRRTDTRQDHPNDLTAQHSRGHTCSRRRVLAVP
jgi:hypothetical protein